MKQLNSFRCLSKKSVGIHYGTFILTTEPIDDPVKLDIARQKYGLDINDFSDSKLEKLLNYNIMLKIISYFFIFISLALANEKQNIIDVLDQYNKAFGKADYSNIAKCFDYPAYFNLQDKTIGASAEV